MATFTDSFAASAASPTKQKTDAFNLCSTARPHMRGFWFATFGWFISFVGWFALAPLMSTIKFQVGLTKDEIYTSNIVAVSTAICARFLIGPLCDRFGPRRPMAWLLIVCAVPLACGVFINDATTLYAVRACVGFIGAGFVPCQFWTTQMFSPRIVGFTNALAGGWGNLGGGATQALMVSLLEAFRSLGFNQDQAWRLALLVPAALWVLTGVAMIFFSDDCPAGHWNNRSPATGKTSYSVSNGLRNVLTEPFTYILMVSYACCFGVELYVDNTAAFYFQEKWNLPGGVAGLIASLFGLMNIFSRAIGGGLSDYAASRASLRGRMVIILVLIFMCGALLRVLAVMNNLWNAVVVMVVFSVFCQASCGAVYGLVPFVSPENTGLVSGMVGAGGSMGAVTWGFIHRSFGASNNESMAYLLVGSICMGGACLLLVGRLHGAALLPLCGHDGRGAYEKLLQTKQNPHKDAEAPIPN